MEHLVDYTGTEDGLCLHCFKELECSSTKDHVPTRGFLTPPYPPHLPTVDVCEECNNRLSKDELYVMVLLGCVLSGTVNPSELSDTRMADRLRRDPKLAKRIADQRVTKRLDGQETVWWTAEVDTVARVLVKNARGHIKYENGLALRESPDSVRVRALCEMSGDALRKFESGDAQDMPLLPEVGGRALTRLASGADLVDGWVEVQRDAYRYMVSSCDTTTTVRIVIREYLAAEVIWHTTEFSRDVR